MRRGRPVGGSPVRARLAATRERNGDRYGRYRNNAPQGGFHGQWLDSFPRTRQDEIPGATNSSWTAGLIGVMQCVDGAERTRSAGNIYRCRNARLASQTRTSTFRRSEARQSWMTGRPPARGPPDWLPADLAEAFTALVVSSEISSSTVSARAVRPHSQSSCLVCSRAQGTAPGRAANSRRDWSGQAAGAAVASAGRRGSVRGIMSDLFWGICLRAAVT